MSATRGYTFHIIASRHSVPWQQRCSSHCRRISSRRSNALETPRASSWGMVCDGMAMNLRDCLKSPFSCLEKWGMAYCENGRHRNSVCWNRCASNLCPLLCHSLSWVHEKRNNFPYSLAIHYPAWEYPSKMICPSTNGFSHQTSRNVQGRKRAPFFSSVVTVIIIFSGLTSICQPLQ